MACLRGGPGVRVQLPRNSLIVSSSAASISVRRPAWRAMLNRFNGACSELLDGPWLSASWPKTRCSLRHMIG